MCKRTLAVGRSRQVADGDRGATSARQLSRFVNHVLARTGASQVDIVGHSQGVIETTHDEIVTPYTNAFLNGTNVTNITIQNQCPSDGTGYIGIAMDEPVADALNQLSQNPNPSFTATCNSANFGPGL